MSTQWPEFCGPCYQFTNEYAAVERTVNLYNTANEQQGEKKFVYTMDQFPCNQPFGQLPVPAPFNQRNRGLIAVVLGTYVIMGVNGNVFFGMDTNGIYYNLGTLAGSAPSNDSYPVSMCANGNGQILIIDPFNLLGYVWDQPSTTFTALSTVPDFLTASSCTFQDGYALTVYFGSKRFQISGNTGTPVGDFRVWDAANISVQEGQADPLLRIISSREYVRILGTRRSQVYYNVGPSGIGGFPFQSYNDTFIETGLMAPNSLVDLGDSLAWIGADDRGSRACWRDFGFQPERISTFAVEQAWQSYGASITEAISFAFIWKGHTMMQVTFPGIATWVYDATVSKLTGKQTWTERNLYNLPSRPELFHAYGTYFNSPGTHFVGSNGSDGNPGAIYQYADSPWTDCYSPDGTEQQQLPVVPIRVLPFISGSLNRFKLDRLRIDMQVGVGNVSFPNPQLNLMISGDAGDNFGPLHQSPIGSATAKAQKVYFNGLGARQGNLTVIKIYGDGSAVPYNFVNAYYDGQELAT